MNRAPARLDRSLSLLFAVALVAGGGVLLDHRLHWVRDWPERADLSSVRRVFAESWMPWAAGAAGGILVLAGLWLLLAQLRRSTVSRIRLRASDAGGALAVDTRSLNTVVTASLEREGGLQAGHASVVDDRAVGQMVLVRGQVDPRTDGPDLIAGARAYERDVSRAFGGQLRARLLVDRPKQRRDRSAPSRVQ